MIFTKSMRKFIVFLSLLFVLAVSVSCSKEIESDLTIVPINPLFDSSDSDSTSLQGGNTYYSDFLSSDGTFIYYQSVDGKSLMKSEYDGEKPFVLSNRFPSFINISGNFVFFIEGESSGKIFKVDTDGKGETMVIDANAKSLIVTSDYIFYIDTKDGFVYSALHDGSKKTLLFNQITSQILLDDNNIYFQTAKDSKGIFVLSLDNFMKYGSSLLLASVIPPASASLSSSVPSVNDSGATISSSSVEFFAAPTAVIDPALADIEFIELVKTDSELIGINIKNGMYFFIDSSNGSFITASENKKLSILLKKSVASPFIVSDQYLYYINQEDESRLYRISIIDPSVNEMVVNDRVNQFVVCGHSIYYRRENKSDIFLTPIKGGISNKIT